MPRKRAAKSVADIVSAVGRYPEEAFLFVQDGLSYAVERIHGPESEAHLALAHYIHENNIDWSDLAEKYHTGGLSEELAAAVEAAGGPDKLNRHVSGRELCWGLRDFALERWGLMSRVVLESWKVRSTRDFGEIVFAFIHHQKMQKQEGDTLQDFDEVYSFDEAFDEAFRIPRGDEEKN